MSQAADASPLDFVGSLDSVPKELATDLCAAVDNIMLSPPPYGRIICMPLEVHITRILCWASVRDAVVICFMLGVSGRQIHPREMGWGGILFRIGCARVRAVGCS